MKLLEARSAVQNTMDGALVNNYITGGQNGSLSGCIPSIAGANIVISRGTLMVQGHRVAIKDNYKVLLSDSMLGTLPDGSYVFFMHFTEYGTDAQIEVGTWPLPATGLSDESIAESSGEYTYELFEFVISDGELTSLTSLIKDLKEEVLNFKGSVALAGLDRKATDSEAADGIADNLIMTPSGTAAAIAAYQAAETKLITTTEYKVQPSDNKMVLFCYGEDDGDVAIHLNGQVNDYAQGFEITVVNMNDHKMSITDPSLALDIQSKNGKFETSVQFDAARVIKLDATWVTILWYA